MATPLFRRREGRGGRSEKALTEYTAQRCYNISHAWGRSLSLSLSLSLGRRGFWNERGDISKATMDSRKRRRNHCCCSDEDGGWGCESFLAFPRRRIPLPQQIGMKRLAKFENQEPMCTAPFFFVLAFKNLSSSIQTGWRLLAPVGEIGKRPPRLSLTDGLQFICQKATPLNAQWGERENRF